MTETPDQTAPEPEESGRDDATFSMFGEAEMGRPADEGYQVLARKYRPRLFSDLIGQEAMVRTLRNAFETRRVAHAFMLTGVRGVGKTTTARLLARALNYKGEDADEPRLELDPPGVFCDAIMKGSHPDVLELDAASRTGVAEMRDLLDGVRYAPNSARYKVYIIDEVHMLSTASFNALLKTLEEPPPHVKFIFATTEIRKVPITVLSRCQRFDLKRLESVALAEHLGRVATSEGADISNEGLALIARAAEGSVRDGLSILDQAIVQALEGTPISGEVVREMLGLGDRLRLLDAFELALSGQAEAAMTEVADQVRAGADPLVILKDMLEIAADIATVQAASDTYTLPGPADWTRRTKELARSVSPAQAQRYWQILLSGYRDTQTAPETETALRMVVLRLVAAAGLPSPEEAMRLISEGGATGDVGKSQAQRAAAQSPAVEGPRSLDDILDLLSARKEVRLWGEVRQYIRPVDVAPGRLLCGLTDKAPQDLLRRLTAVLEAVTGIDWDIRITQSDAETPREAAERQQHARITEAGSLPEIAAALAVLPGAEIVKVEDMQALEDAHKSDNVVGINTRKRG